MEKLTFKVTLSKLMLTVTAMCVALLLLATGLLIRDMVTKPMNLYFDAAVIAVIVLLPLWFYLKSPRSITLTDDSLVLRKVAGRLVMPFSEIERIAPYTGSSGLRLWGSGGLFGCIGLFTNKEIGRHHEYVGDFKDAFLVVMSSGKKYVLSCEDSNEVVGRIAKSLPPRPGK